jgi:hypothetical protein
MISGAHSIIYSKNVDADRTFFQNVLKLPSVDVGGGWLIFGLPPGEVAVHPSRKNNIHEFYLMCDDVQLFVAEMTRNGLSCEAVVDQGYGLMTAVMLPGGGKLGVYQPRHERPKHVGSETKDRSKVQSRRPKKKPVSSKSKTRSRRTKSG